MEWTLLPPLPWILHVGKTVIIKLALLSVFIFNARNGHDTQMLTTSSCTMLFSCKLRESTVVHVYLPVTLLAWVSVEYVADVFVPERCTHRTQPRCPASHFPLHSPPLELHCANTQPEQQWERGVRHSRGSVGLAVCQSDMWFLLLFRNVQKESPNCPRCGCANHYVAPGKPQFPTSKAGRKITPAQGFMAKSDDESAEHSTWHVVDYHAFLYEV